MAKKGIKSDKGENKKEEQKKGFIWNVPNALTLSRLVFTFILIYLILFGYPENFMLVGVLFVIAAVTDWFDGFFARKLNQKSELGARLDQVIDRVFMIPIIIVLLYKFYSIDQNLAFLLAACLSREIVGTPGLVIRMIRNTDAYRVKYIGKVVTFVQSIAIILIIFRFDNVIYFWITVLAAIATGLLGIIAGFDYLRDSLK
ncbi:CDP-alcohol phosphatidyltransferase family protein [Candidatus Pacearchaeota archaeon]|nr:CDP-alcohol phosphatidyltransferase family protein [Candidatus Pacearchaeota archaeon]